MSIRSICSANSIRIFCVMLIVCFFFGCTNEGPASDPQSDSSHATLIEKETWPEEIHLCLLFDSAQTVEQVYIFWGVPKPDGALKGHRGSASFSEPFVSMDDIPPMVQGKTYTTLPIEKDSYIDDAAQLAFSVKIGDEYLGTFVFDVDEKLGTDDLVFRVYDSETGKGLCVEVLQN